MRITHTPAKPRIGAWHTITDEPGRLVRRNVDTGEEIVCFYDETPVSGITDYAAEIWEESQGEHECIN